MKILVSRLVKVLAVFKPSHIRTRWENKTFECPVCGCQFLLEVSDGPKILARIEEMDAGELGLKHFLSYLVFCPEGCGTTVKIGSDFPAEEEYEQIPRRN